jgi:hypothetical protein
MAMKIKEPTPEPQDAEPIERPRRRRNSIITKQDGVLLDPPLKPGRKADPAKKAENERIASTRLPRGESRPLDLKPIKKSPEQTAKERSSRRKKAADEAEIHKYQLRNKIMDLREGGASIRSISEHLTSQGEKGCSRAMVFNHLEAGLDELRKEFTIKYKNFIQVRLNQMQRVELAHFKRLCNHELTPDDFEKLSRGLDRIWKRMDDLIDRLTDNHKTTKVEVTGADGGPLETVTRVIMPKLPEPEIEPDTEE